MQEVLHRIDAGADSRELYYPQTLGLLVELAKILNGSSRQLWVEACRTLSEYHRLCALAAKSQMDEALAAGFLRLAEIWDTPEVPEHDMNNPSILSTKPFREVVGVATALTALCRPYRGNLHVFVAVTAILRQYAPRSSFPVETAEQLLEELVTAIYYWYRETHDPDLALEAIEILNRLINASSVADTQHPSRLSTLAAILLERDDAAGDDRREALRLMEESIRLTSNEDARLSLRENNLGVALMMQCKEDYSKDAIDRAIAILRRASFRKRASTSDRLMAKYSLAKALYLRGAREGENDSLEEAADLLRPVVRGAESGGGQATEASAMLIGVCIDIYGRTNEQSWLVDSIEVALRAVSAPSTPLRKSPLLDMFMQVLAHRYGEFELGDDLDPVLTHYISIPFSVKPEEKRAHLGILAMLLWERFRERRGPADLGEAIAALRVGLDTSATLKERDHYAADLADAYRVSYELFGHRQDLEQGISVARKLCTRCEEVGSREGRPFFLLGIALKYRFAISRSPEDRTSAIHNLRRSLESALEPGYVSQAKAVLGDILFQDATSFEEGLQLLRQAMELETIDERRDNAGRLLIRALLKKWSAAFAESDLEEAQSLALSLGVAEFERAEMLYLCRRQAFMKSHSVEGFRGLLLATQAMATHLPAQARDGIRDTLGDLLEWAAAMSASGGDEGGLAQAVQLIVEMANRLPSDDHWRALALLGVYHNVGFPEVLTSNPVPIPPLAQLLNEAVGADIASRGTVNHDDGVDFNLVFQASIAVYFSTKSRSLLYWILNFLAGIVDDHAGSDEARERLSLRFGWFAVATREDHHDREVFVKALEYMSGTSSRKGLEILAEIRKALFDLSDAEHDLAAAIAAAAAALELPSARAGDDSNLWNLLGSLERKRFESFGDVQALWRSIEAGRRAVEQSTTLKCRLRCESELSGALRMKAELEGDFAAFREAVEMSRRVLNSTPEDDGTRAAREFRTGRFLLILHDWTHDRSYLDESISLARSSLTRGHTEARQLLAEALLVAADPGDAESLTQATSQLEAAVRETPSYALGSSSITLVQLGIARLALFDLLGDVESDLLPKAISSLERAATDDSLATTPIALAELAGAYNRMARLTSNPELFSQSRVCLDKALTLAEPGTAGHSRAALELGDWHVEHAARSKDMAGLERAAEDYRAVAQSGAAPSHLRLSAATKWLKILRNSDQSWSGRLREAYEISISATAQMSEAGRMIEDVANTFDLGELVSESVAAALAAREARTAFSWLERGRGLTIAASINEAVLAKLEADDPPLGLKLRESFQSVSSSRLLSTSSIRPQAGEHAGGSAKVIERWRELIASANAFVGQETFIEAPSLEELRSVLKDATLVYVCAGERLGHALVVGQPDVLQVVNLPGADVRSVKGWVESILVATRHSRSVSPDKAVEPNERLLNALDSVWRYVVSPVFETMGIVPDGNVGRRRIVWCPTGVASFLPIHAAARNGSDLRDSALSCAVSSYVPTARAFIANTRLHSQRQALKPEDRVPILAVGVPYSPGLPDIGYALEEVEAVSQAPGARILIGKDANRSRILNELRDCDAVHFAAHAYDNPSLPMRSHLLAYDGPISFVDISQVGRRPRGLACLSACSTASPGGAPPDEALHLASAFMLSGYSDVIATMWPVADRIASIVAEMVYGASVPVRPGTAASACREAALRLRDAYPLHPTIWAPYVHFGTIGD